MGLTCASGLLALVVAGCGAAPTVQGPPVTSPTAAPTTASPTAGSPGTEAGVPDAAQSLTELGFEHAPPLQVWVPAGAVIAQRIDQPNVVTIVFSRPAGPELAAFYRTTLPLGGWSVSADANDSLVFGTQGWDGAFTASAQVSGLTLRRL